MAATISKIQELRSRSGSGVLNCKKALEANNLDIEKAIIWLRKKGLASAVKKSGRATSEGVIAMYNDKNSSTIIELASETDFVGKNSKFLALADNLVKAAHNFKGTDVNKFLTSYKEKCETVSIKEIISEHIATIGENIVLKRINKLSSNKGVIIPYLHNKLTNNIGKIGVLVALDGDYNEEVEEFGKQLAMHIAALKPLALDIKDLDSTMVNKEKSILREQALERSSSTSIINKMIEGRMRKFFESVVLLHQPFIFNQKIKVSQAKEEVKTSTNCNFDIAGYARYAIGQ